MNPLANAALGVRTADGSIVPLVDFRLAADNRLVFTTTADGQCRAVFDFYYRGPEGWTYLDSLSLPHIPPARAGLPDLELQAHLDGQGDVRLQLLDPTTGKPAAFLLEARILRGLQADRPPAPVSPAGRRPAADPSPQRRRTVLLALVACALLTAGGLLLAYNARHRRTFAESPAQQGPVPLSAEPASPPSAPAVALPRPPSAPAPRPANTAAHRIAWGETLWRIAERYYGERGLYQELAESNILDNPDFIIAGESLRLPAALAGHRRRGSGE
jgi:hypothetical protein